MIKNIFFKIILKKHDDIEMSRSDVIRTTNKGRERRRV